MQKLLVSDLDGTLIGSNKQISPAVRTAVERWRAAGNQFVIATGRMFSSAEYFADQLDVADYIICCSGAVTYHDKSIMAESTVPIDYVARLWQIMTRRGGYVQIYSDRTLIANKRSDLALSYERHAKELPAAYQIPIRYLERWPDNFADSIHKLSFTFDSDALASNIIAELGDMQGVNSFKSLDHLYDIVAADASKGLAVKRLLPTLGIAPENTYVIGDNENDVSMFEHFAGSAIMETAPANLHHKAARIVPSADQDGLAQYVTSLL